MVGRRGRRWGREHVLRGIKRGTNSMQTSERVDQTAQKTRKLIWWGEANVVVALYQFATVGWLVNVCKLGCFVHVLGSVPKADKTKTSRPRMPCVNLMMCIRGKDMLVSFMFVVEMEMHSAKNVIVGKQDDKI